MGVSIAGESINISCTVSKRVHGLENTPTAAWTGQIEDDVETIGQNTSSASLIFSRLKTSHGKNYTCHGIVISSALSVPYVVMENYPVIVNSKL